MNPDAGMVADFKKRVDDYVKLREKASAAAPVELQEKSKPADIVTAEKSMAHRVRAARAGAKPGDIFTPATQAMFRRLLRQPLTKESRRGRQQGDHQRRRAGTQGSAVQGECGIP